MSPEYFGAKTILGLAARQRRVVVASLRMAHALKVNTTLVQI